MSGMTTDSATLALLFEGQTWDDPDDVPTRARYHRALSGAQPLSEDEQTQLLLSPTARMQYFAARRLARLAASAAWAASGVVTTGAALAADGGADDQAALVTADFTLRLHRDDTDAQAEWLVTLELSARARAAVTESGLGVRLVDAGGLEWFSGEPDELGTLSSTWPHPGSPAARLAKFSVRLEFV